MRSLRRVLTNITLSLLAATLSSSTASAQFFEPVVRALDLATDVPRSPRLLGMGRLSLVIPDRDHSITLWDFAGNPTGVFADDSVSSLDMRPGTGSVSGEHDLAGSRVRQDLAGRVTNFQMETFHRDNQGSAFGAVVVANSARRDVPTADDTELRRTVGLPEIMPIFNGPLPYFGHGKIRYAVRMRFGGEHLLDEFKTITSNVAGEFISLDGQAVRSPNSFSPDDYHASKTGLGAALSYPIGKGTILALGLDGLQEKIKGVNNGQRYQAEQNEKRPFAIGQATLIGHLGSAFEYGVDGHAWTSHSEQDWFYTISAGVGAVPLSGRGKLQERTEKGSTLNSRVRWTAGSIELGGQLWTGASKTSFTPPDPGDPTSLNTFLSTIYYRQGIDTLSLPDSVVANESRDYSWGYGAGASWKFARGILGAEWHWSRDLFQQTLSGLGPRRIAWDVRSGMEYRCNPVVTGRIGYGFRWIDEDDLTAQNEFKGQSANLGLGLRAPGASWDFQAGYELEFQQSDFGDPTQKRSNRQQLAGQIHWGF